jgi:hypothetical protein
MALAVYEYGAHICSASCERFLLIRAQWEGARGKGSVQREEKEEELPRRADPFL